MIDSLTNHKQMDGVYSSVIDRLILEAVFGITSSLKVGNRPATTVFLV